MSRLLAGIGGRIGLGMAGLAGGGFFLDQCVYTVMPGHRGLIFDRYYGIEQKVRDEGAHLLVPMLQYPVIMDVRTTQRTISTVTGTKDLQRVNLSLRVLSHPDEQKLASIYQTLGYDWAERVLPSVGNEVLKAVVARYNADQLLTLRDQVSREIREVMESRCSKFNVLLDDVSIIHLNFSKDFAAAIEAKQVAEQMAERAKFVVAKAEQEKQARIVRSEGDAEAALLVANALQKNGQGLIEMRRIEAAQAIATKMARNPNVTYLPGGEGGAGILLNMPAK